MEGHLTLGNSTITGGNVFDVANYSFVELPEKRLQVQSSADDKKEKQDGKASDYPIKLRRPKIRIYEALVQRRIYMQRVRANYIALYGKLHHVEQELILKSLEAENVQDEPENVQDHTNYIADLHRRIQGLMEEFKMENQKALKESLAVDIHKDD